MRPSMHLPPVNAFVTCQCIRHLTMLLSLISHFIINVKSWCLVLIKHEPPLILRERYFKRVSNILSACQVSTALALLFDLNLGYDNYLIFYNLYKKDLY